MCKPAVFLSETILIHLHYESTEPIAVLIWRRIGLNLIVKLCFAWRRRGKLCDPLQVGVCPVSLASLELFEISFLYTRENVFAHTRPLVQELLNVATCARLCFLVVAYFIHSVRIFI